MAKRTPAQYNWSKALFNDRRLHKHFTHPRRSKIRTVTLHHSTIVGNGNGTALETMYNVWQKRQASANYGVDGEQVWQYVGDFDAAWANAHSSNHETLSIEHTNLTGSPSWKISDKTMATGQRLVASLHLLYGLGRPSRKTVKMHRDYYATACPGPYMVAHLNEYIANAARIYDQMKAPAPAKPAPKPKWKTVPWHGVAFLNVWGDDGGKGQASFNDRLPAMVADLTQHDDEIIAVCELRPEQEKAFTKAMKAAGYELAGHSHRMAFYVLVGVKVGRVSFYKYKTQNKGATEGILRLRAKVNGHWNHYGVTHLDYRDGFDYGRMDQAEEGVAAMKRMGVRYLFPRLDRSVILGDFNSKSWVVERTLKPAGYFDVARIRKSHQSSMVKASGNARIDYITTGSKRPVIESEQITTQSDHRIERCVLGKNVKV